MVTFLQKEAETILALGNFRIILCNLQGAIYPHTEPAVILAAEVIPSAGGYASVTFNPSTGTYNSTTLKFEWAPVTAVFNEAVGGTGYQFTDAVLWQGRGEISSRPISSIDTTAETIACPSHGLVSGDLSFVASTASLPSGLALQRYYTEVLNANTVRLHTTAALNSPVDIANSGSGSLRLIHANGYFVRNQSFGLTTVNPGSSQSLIINWKRRYG